MSWYSQSPHHSGGAYTHHDAHQGTAPYGVDSYSAPRAQSPRYQHEFQNSNGVVTSFHTHYGAPQEFNAADYEGAAYGQHAPSQYRPQTQAHPASYNSYHSEPAPPYDNQVYNANHNPYIPHHQQAKPTGVSKDRQFNPRGIHATFSYAQPLGDENNGFANFGGYPSTHQSQQHVWQYTSNSQGSPHFGGKTSVGTGTGALAYGSTQHARRSGTNPFDASHLHFESSPCAPSQSAASTTTTSTASGWTRSTAPPPASTARAAGSRPVGPAGCSAGGRGGPVYSSSMHVSPGGARAYPHQPQYPLQHSTQPPTQYASQYPAQYPPQQPPQRGNQFSSSHHPAPYQPPHASLHHAQHYAANSPGAAGKWEDFNPRASSSGDAAAGQVAAGNFSSDGYTRPPPAQRQPSPRGYQPRHEPAQINGHKPAAAAYADDFDPRSSEVAPAPKAAPVLERRMSSASQVALDSLGKYSDRLGEIVWQVESVEGKLASGELHGREELGKAKTALGQLNGVLEKLQLDGVDSITVGDLGSGKEQARAARKKLNNSIEELVPRIMDLNKRLAAHIKNCPSN